MTALMAIPLIAMIGLAVDLARVWLVKSRLQMSLDAAVLVAARDIGTGGTSTDGLRCSGRISHRVSSASTVGYLGATATTPIVYNPAPGVHAGSVQMTSTATVNPTLLGVLGIGPMTVGAASTAETAATGLELALVLDNTGSMAGWPITSVVTRVAGTGEHPVWRQRHAAESLGVGCAIRRRGQHRQHPRQLAGRRHHQSGAVFTLDMDGLRDGANRPTGASNGDDSNDKTPSQAPLTPFLYKSTYHVYPNATGPSYTLPEQARTR